jgi:Helix-turn-helix domain
MAPKLPDVGKFSASEKGTGADPANGQRPDIPSATRNGTRSSGAHIGLFEWQRAIRDSELPPMTRHVALTLSTYMNAEGGSAFPGAARLARDTGRSERKVRERLGLLVKAGWLVEVERGGLRGEERRANRYQARTPVDNSRTPDLRSGIPLTSETPTPDLRSPHHSIEQSIDQQPETLSEIHLALGPYVCPLGLGCDNGNVWDEEKNGVVRCECIKRKFARVAAAEAATP